MLKMIFAALLPALLVACSTTPVAPADAVAADPARVLAFQEVRSSTDRATITVVRDSGYIGSGCYLGVHINGTLAARLAPSERVSFIVRPGESLIRVGSDPMASFMCSIDKLDWIQRETLLRVGDSKLFRVSINSSGAVDVFRAD